MSALVAVAAAIMLLFGGGFGAYKLIFETKDGTLVVEVDGDADVRFKNGELQIYDADGKLKYTLKSGERDKKMVPGKYTVQVVSADGVKLNTDKFEMSKDGKVVLRVTADAVAVAKKEPKLDPTKDPDRRAAEWVLSIGGTIKIKENGNERQSATVGDLPRGAFELVGVYLDLNPKATDAALANFKDCKNLTELVVRSKQVSDAGLAHFKDCKNLTYISLQETGVSDAGLAHFKDCKNLTYLNLAATQVSDGGLAHFKDCKNLTYLHLGSTQVSDAGLAHFKNCKNLTGLHLNDTKVSDAGLAHFKDCKNLEALVLSATRVSDAGLAHFKGCKNLTVLGLQTPRVSDAGLANFKDCKNLTYLSLNGAQVSDAGLAHFQDCKNLAYLQLNATQVGDAGLADLAGCLKLTYANVKKTKVTEAGVKNLAAALPQCRIVWDGGVIEPKSPSEAARPMIAALLKSGAEVRVNQGQKAIETIDQWTAQDRLRSIQFNATPERNPLADPAVLAALQTLPAAVWDVTGYETVMLYGPITEDQLKALVESPGVRPIAAIRLHDTPLKDSALVHLARLPGLTQVALSLDPGITDDGIKHLAAIPKFSSLILVRNAGLTVAALGNLRTRELKDLALVQLSGVDDMSVMQLAGMPSLKNLQIEGAKLTADGVKKLAAVMPQCRIQWDGGVIEPRPIAEAARPAVAALLKGGVAVQVNDGSGRQWALKSADELSGNVRVHILEVIATSERNPLADPAVLAALKDLPAAACTVNPSFGVAGPVSAEQFRAAINTPGLSRATNVVINVSNPVDPFLALLSRMSNLTHLVVHQMTDVGLKQAAALPKVVTLTIGNAKVTSGGLAVLRGSSITLLNLGGCVGVDDAAIEHFAAMPTLTQVTVNGTKMTADGVKKLAAARPDMRIEWTGGVIEPTQSGDPDRRAAEWVLSIGGTISIKENGQERGVQAVGELPRGAFELTVVRFQRNPKVSDAGLAHFKDCKNLTVLDLNQTKVSDAGLAHFKDCKNLTHLDLDYTEVSDAGLAHFKDCKNLTILVLGNTKVSDAGLARFRDCKNLTSLVLGNTKVSDAGLAHFQECKKLTILVLGATQVGDTGLAHFQDCKNLTHLHLHSTRVSDAGLAHFNECKNLTELILATTQVSDTGLAHFKDCKNLTYFNLLKTKVTAAGIGELKKALPQCKIEWDGGVIEPGKK